MFIKTNPNPAGAYVGDCVVRAIAIAFNESWYDAYMELMLKGLVLCDMPSSNRVWGELLRDKGYKRYIIPNECVGCYTIRDFCGEYFKGKYVVGTGTHVVTVIDGNYYDTWDSGDEQPIFYFKEE